MTLQVSHVKALRSDLKQYDRVLLGQSNACVYAGAYSMLLLNLFCLFYDDIDFLMHLMLKLICYVLLCFSSVGTKSYRYLRPSAFLLHAGDSIMLGL